MEIGWSKQLLDLQMPEKIEISSLSGVNVQYIN
jgi:hypothetical protein